jgi:hypothetical protein
VLRHLTETELGETLARAREIAAETGELEAGGELETYVHAAAEVGIPAEAMRQALRERAPLIQQPPAVGDLCFAPAADGWYPARILSLNEHSARVHFVSGSEHDCPVRELQPFSLIPGRKLQADLKNWGWYDCRVERYDAERGQVYLIEDDWAGGKNKAPLHKLRLVEKHVRPEVAAAEAQKQRRFSAAAVYWAAALGFAGGYVAQFLIPQLLRFLP